MKRTRIVCTIGPSSEKKNVLNSLIKSGMNIARLNFSHGTHKNHKTLIKNIRSISKIQDIPVPIIADLQGPKLRIGGLNKDILLKKNKKIIFTTGRVSGDKIPVTYPLLHKIVKRNHRILLDDGLLELIVLHVDARDIICKVLVGGKLSSHKGMNLPDSKLRIPSITEKDKADLEFAMKEKVQFIAVSFVRTAQDIKDLQKIILKNSKKLKIESPKIIAKIETAEVLDNFPSVLKLVDAIMVARGDLGIEIPAEDVPLRQKEIVAMCRQAGKPVIVATQMLDSMIKKPRPTRAEVSDVANAVMEHVDAVMLSGETASGKYPKDAVSIMNKIILEVEKSPYDDFEIDFSSVAVDKFDALGEAVHVLVKETGIKYVIDISNKGFYKFVSKWRPEVDILIKSDNLVPNLFWGVRTFNYNGSNVKSIITWLKKHKLIKGSKAIFLTEKNTIEILD